MKKQICDSKKEVQKQRRNKEPLVTSILLQHHSSTTRIWMRKLLSDKLAFMPVKLTSVVKKDN